MEAFTSAECSVLLRALQLFRSVRLNEPEELRLRPVEIDALRDKLQAHRVHAIAFEALSQAV